MKRYNVVLLIFVLLTCSGRAISQDPEFPEKERKVTTAYNDKTDMTVVRFGPMHLMNFSSGQDSYVIADGELRLSAFFTYKGKTFTKPESIGLVFLSVNVPTNRWELSKQGGLEITADDGHWEFPNVQLVDSKKNSNLVIESLGVSLPCEAFARIANAKKIKMRLGDRRFDLTKQHSAALRDLAGRARC